ncbi:MAG: (2Fe-2S)-binding protein, partial [Xanthomonadaceae bacterium]|nr:(2Fe-2S)-binding protein [Xanthomonadaceae bacterium]
MLSIVEIDHGTPKATSRTMIALQIDGRTVRVPEGTSIMRAAAQAGINIPRLCASEMLEPFGSCRLCLVEIEGRKGYPASCTTPVAAGMSVSTQTPKLADIRRGVMELYISDHPLDCLTCPANGHCELQDMAGVVGLREVRYGYQGANHVYPEMDIEKSGHGWPVLDSGDQGRSQGKIPNPLFVAKDESNPYFTFDPSKCIACSRCVRACDEIQGTFALTIQGRGFESKVAASQDNRFLDSECVSCGACVQACPTATLSEKSLIDKGQAEHSVVTT